MEPMTAGLLAMGAGSLISGLGSFFGGSSAAKAQRDAAEKQLQATRETNALNERLWHEGRGSNGSAILPEYFGGMEKQIGLDAASLAQAMMNFRGGAAGQLASAEGVLGRYEPMIDAGDQALTDIFSGATAARRRTALDPVLAARTKLGRTRTDAINQSLSEVLAGLRSTRAASGFRGTSTFDTARTLDATTGARAQAATEQAQAGLDNATALQGLDESNLSLMLNSIDAPFSRATALNTLKQLPITTVADNYARAMSPLSFFKLGGSQMPYASTPTIQPTTTNGQVIGAAVSGFGQQIGNLFSQRLMMQQLQDMMQQQQLTSYFNSPGFSNAINTGINAGGAGTFTPGLT